MNIIHYLRLARAHGVRFTRMNSTLHQTFCGRSGCQYVPVKALRQYESRPERTIWRARSKNKDYVLKPLHREILELSEDLKAEFEHDADIRTHIDFIEENRIVVFEFVQETLLAFINRMDTIPFCTCKQIYRRLAEAVGKVHAKGWRIMDLKPDNVLIESHANEQGELVIDKLMLYDLDLAWKDTSEKRSSTYWGPVVGNIMWRSPEAQAGRGVGAASDMYSLGLIGIFLFTKELILEADWEELRKEGTKPIVEVMARTLRFFGPLPKGLLDTIDDDNWRIILTTIESTFSEDNPRYPFLDWEDWTNLDDGTKAFLAGPLNLDPAKRPTVEEFLEHGWWRE